MNFKLHVEIVLFWTIFCLIGLSQSGHPLQSYINDNSDISVLNYTLLQTNYFFTHDVYILNVTSLKWFDETFSSASIWWHIVHVNVPINLNISQPILFYINSGDNDNTSLNVPIADIIGKISPACKCVTVSMGQVPNQPIIFSSDPEKQQKTEDEIVAWSFREWHLNRLKFPNTSSNSLPVLFPMTKAVKRTMDSTLKFLNTIKSKTSGKFVAVGASKRGWTSLLVTAVDDRVIANIPIVFDLISLNQCLHQMYTKFNGAYTFALHDYWSQNITLNLDSVEGYDLQQLVDPISNALSFAFPRSLYFYTGPNPLDYFENYRNKQFLFMLAASDEFMMPWNTLNFWRELVIQTNNSVYMRRLANTGHYLKEREFELAINIINFLNILNPNKPDSMPIVKWQFANNFTHGVIDISLKNLGQFSYFMVNGVHARTLSTSRKDFRVKTLGAGFTPTSQKIEWESVKLSEQVISLQEPSSVYKYRFAIPRDSVFTSYIGFYIEVVFNMTAPSLIGSQLFTVTTEMNIIPEFDPIGDCHDIQCVGTLV